MEIKKSVELYKEAVELMPGGVNSPVRAFKSVGGNPIFMKSGKGSILVDEDNNSYIDYCMSWGPMILGHADEDVISSIIETAKNGTSFGTPNRYEVEIAQRVIKRFDSIETIRFVNSGTEAVMSAIRLARGFTGKKKIIKFDGCYHGHADHLLVAAGSGLATFGTPDSAGVTSENAQDTIVVPYGDFEKLSEVVEHESRNIAAVIMEPVPCNYGLIPPTREYLQKVRDLCSEKYILLIFDEVITGLRLAAGGAQEYYGIKADLTTLGKIIGGGLPVGAYGGPKEIMKQIAPDGPVYQAGTLSGNPLAMVAGIATLDKLEKIDAYKKLKEKAGILGELMNPVVEKYKGKLKFLQLESVFAFYFTDRDSIQNLDDVKSSDMSIFAKFHNEMLSQGIYLSPSGYEVGFLSTAHSNEDLEKTVDAVTKSLEKVL